MITISLFALCQAGFLGGGYEGQSLESGYGGDFDIHQGGYDGGHEEYHVSY